jgi:hypothetical protein
LISVPVNVVGLPYGPVFGCELVPLVAMTVSVVGDWTLAVVGLDEDGW